MKSSARVGVLLTALMLVLVLIAGLVFLFQARQTLLTRNDTLTMDLQQVEGVRDAAIGTRDALTAVFATVESDSVLLEGELVESQQEVDALTEQLAASNNRLSELEQAQLEMLSRPPQVSILAPGATVLLEVGDTVELIAVATDAVGISTLFLTVDDQIIGNYVVSDLPLITATERWTPLTAGDFVMGVEASNGRTTTIVTRTLTVVDPANEPLGTTADGNNSVRAKSLRAIIGANVSDLRGLRPRFPIVEVVLSKEELQQRAASGLTELEAATGAAMLTSFDFIQTANTAENRLEPVGTSYYDPATGEMLVLNDETSLTPSAQLAYVHQFMRLLLDQNFGLGDDRGVANEDVQLALSALAVGEANLVQNLYLRGDFFSGEERTAIFNTLDVTETAVLPPYLFAKQQFQQVSGLDFVQVAYDEGGFTAVSQLWTTLPQSTEQILHPDSYLAGDAPQSVTIPSLAPVLGEEWVLLTENTLGEMRLRAYLAQQLNPEQVETAASGWGGDRYVVYQRETDGALVMVLWLMWDSLDDSVEFAALYPTYPTRLFNTSGELRLDSNECWEGDDLICLVQMENETFIVRVPDLEMATAVTTLLNSEE
jgi:hypothetical protein